MCRAPAASGPHWAASLVPRKPSVLVSFLSARGAPAGLSPPAPPPCTRLRGAGTSPPAELRSGPLGLPEPQASHVELPGPPKRTPLEAASAGGGPRWGPGRSAVLVSARRPDCTRGSPAAEPAQLFTVPEPSWLLQTPGRSERALISRTGGRGCRARWTRPPRRSRVASSSCPEERGSLPVRVLGDGVLPEGWAGALGASSRPGRWEDEASAPWGPTLDSGSRSWFSGLGSGPRWSLLAPRGRGAVVSVWVYSGKGWLGSSSVGPAAPALR